MKLLELSQPIEFEWDSGNQDKSLKKHGITNQEAEEIFLNFNIIFEDINHSLKENRFIILGKSTNEKLIFSSFTARNSKVRIISSRPASKKERINYEQALKKTA